MGLLLLRKHVFLKVQIVHWELNIRGILRSHIFESFEVENEEWWEFENGAVCVIIVVRVFGVFLWGGGCVMEGGGGGHRLCDRDRCVKF